MKRKDYKNPTTKVVMLQHQALLLAGSPVQDSQTSVQDYEWHNETEE